MCKFKNLFTNFMHENNFLNCFVKRKTIYKGIIVNFLRICLIFYVCGELFVCEEVSRLTILSLQLNFYKDLNSQLEVSLKSNV